MMKDTPKAAQKTGGVQPIGNFFAVKKTAGRPKKVHRSSTLETVFAEADKRKNPKAAAPAAAPEAEAQAEAQAEAKRPAPVAKAEPAAKKVRRNYSEGPNKQKMEEAVVAFRKGPIDPITDKPVSQNDFAKKMKLPPSVFSRHLAATVADDVVEPPPTIAAGVAAAAEAQRRRSSGQGKTALVGRPVQRFVVVVIVRMDRANDGMTCPEIYEMIESLCPQLTRQRSCSCCRSVAGDSGAAPPVRARRGC